MSIICGPRKLSLDKNGKECLTVDVILPQKSVDACFYDFTGKTQTRVCVDVLAYMNANMHLHAPHTVHHGGGDGDHDRSFTEGMSIDMDFKIPIIKRKYVGALDLKPIAAMGM